MKTNIHFLSYFTQFFLERKTFHTNVVQKIKTHFMFKNFFFFGNYAAYEKMWKDPAVPGKSQLTVWRMRCARWVPKARKTQAEYVIFFAFQWMAARTDLNTGAAKKMDGIWNRYNLKTTRRIYTFGILKCSGKFNVLDLP